MTTGVHTYDYAIVGAGAAGAILAARLTEDARTRVVLLEAGPDLRWEDCPPEMHAIDPGRIIAGGDLAQFRWHRLRATRTSQQPARAFWRGRGLGGSTAINGLFAVRPEPADLDDWAKAGCTGWGWDEVLPWFNHLEDDLDFGAEPYHGSGGPYPIWRPPLETWGRIDVGLRDAALATGHSWCEDHNAPGTTGLSPYAASVRDGRRVSTNDAYLEPARDRPNLTIIGDALVDRLVLERGAAIAVEVVRRGERLMVNAGQILLAAGAVHSPAILLRSGIGPPDALRALDIEATVPLTGVGQNLADHPGVSVGVLGPDDDSWQSTSGRHGSAFLRYSSGMEGAGDNDMAVLAMSFGPGLVPGMPSGAQLIASVWEPFSRGRLRLDSRDPAADPIVEENMLSDCRDLVRMRDGLRRIIELYEHPAMTWTGSDRLAGSLDNIVAFPERPSDDDLDQLALAAANDVQHIVGTCRMGDPDDPATVVDPSGRVLGVDGLRVIDASIMPTCVRANTVVTTLMIAEKLAAELRKGE